MNFSSNEEDQSMELSLSNSNNSDHPQQDPDNNTTIIIEKEHMFDKSVTPSDVGKLNRLVIPKQHAEKYFPLDSSSNEKGLLLNFEDRNGKPWRFRYSYWNSSQSYVMTKGWSRFVKEKKLDAGDIVSFQRGVGESGKDRLYIDWRRRPEAPDPMMSAQIHNHLLAQSMNWGRVYSTFPRNYEQFSNYTRFSNNYINNPSYHYQQQQQSHQLIIGGNSAGKYYSSTTGPVQFGAVQEGLVIESVPVNIHHHHHHHRNIKSTASNKRLRLFGVNMECSTSSQDQEITNSDTLLLLPSSSSSRLPTSDSSEKGKCSSLSFDLDL
ncbi:hypothetical protein ACFE04_017672 [Oxalis oulophora]